MYLSNYTVVQDEKKVMLEVLKHIENVKLHPAKENWNDYWASFKKSDDPTYLYRDRVYRYRGNYVLANMEAEVEFFKLLKQYLFQKYFSDVEVMAEFGCGSGSNLVQFNKIFPEKKVYAFDWARSAVELANKNEFVIAEEFDMLHPRKIDFGDAKVGVLTCGSMEQLGDQFGPFLEFLKDLKPTICVHVEPIIELYDENSLFDYLAIMYHKKRNYLGNYLTEIKDRCVEVARTTFGNIYNEGYNIVIWR
jgi:hypothetical protein